MKYRSTCSSLTTSRLSHKTQCLAFFDCERYVFVVDDKIEKYKNFIKEEIVNTSHFSKNKEYIVVIDNKDLNS